MPHGSACSRRLHCQSTSSIGLQMTCLANSHSLSAAPVCRGIVASFNNFKIARWNHEAAWEVAQASSPASSSGVPPAVYAGSESLPQLAAGTDCATRFIGSAKHPAKNHLKRHTHCLISFYKIYYYIKSILYHHKNSTNSQSKIADNILG